MSLPPDSLSLSEECNKFWFDLSKHIGATSEETFKFKVVYLIGETKLLPEALLLK